MKTFKNDFFLVLTIIIIAWSITTILSRPTIDNKSINFSLDIVGIGNNNSNSNNIEKPNPFEGTRREIETKQEEIRQEIAIMKAQAGDL
ncbi:hypothetical protein COS74_01800 [bacterium CG06_land_8_20_14_3_00_33_50]|nr:MAG: hypothetical protein AUJ93_01290 [bacterium CG2_30_33_46]PIU76901.1 MAG: hypothetical protein COS74_01800 [bacterium CG06_land_8_20_14_3_00_33_50]PJA72233.1 MAG: hypothetical protein CO152_02680 [bacterium CG_4_9_14_3_um_filter_33_26]